MNQPKVLLLLALLVSACGSVESNADAGLTPGADAAVLPGVDAGTTPGVDAGDVPAGDWAIHHHPCVGNRTTALHVDDDGTLWVGCGDTTSGFGLFRSQDDGATWDAPETTPAGRVAGMRVNGIDRGPDGQLYVAGTIGAMVVRLDTSVSPMPVTEVLTSVPTVGRQYVVGRFRLRSDGSALAESLNGTDLLYRDSPSTGASASMWVDASDAMSPRRQMLDLVVANDQFYGCGSTIAQPPMLFLPSRASSAEPYEFEVLPLSNTFAGELWGIAADGTRVVTVGVDQGSATGKIFVSGADLYDAASYTEIDVTPLVAASTGRTWARGVCMRGDTIVVVGENQPLGGSTGFILLSEDGGASFTDVSPDDRPSTVTQCRVLASGEIVAAGEGGWVGVHD